MASVFLMNRENLSPEPGKKVLKSREYADLVEADRILSNARLEASKIVAEAHAIYEARKAQGYADGIEASKQELAEKIMDTAIASVEYFNSMEKSVAGLVLKAVEKILGDMDDDQLIYKVVKTGIAVARNEKKVRLKVSPQDIKAIQSKMDDLLSSYAGIGLLDVIQDSRLKKGDCIIESELGIVDASLDTQLEAIRKAILKRI